MDISQYAASAEDIDVLSVYQIKNFFRLHTSITKNDCDCAAEKIVRCLVTPTPVQGETSYTVAASTSPLPKVVQFRLSTLDLDVINRARQTYGDFVPNCKSSGMLADVHIYMMDLVPGVAFSRARRQLFSSPVEQHLLRTVQDFARSATTASPLYCAPY